MKTYQGKYLRDIIYPIGGIGSGNIGINGSGALCDFEIYGHPSKRTTNRYAHFAVRYETADGTHDLRVLQGDYLGDCIGGEVSNGKHGVGPQRFCMYGFPHFSSVRFSSQFPFAFLHFSDKTFPLKVKTTAFNPFIPSDSFNSSLPVAAFEIEIENTLNEPCKCSLFTTVTNPFTPSVNQAVDNGLFLSGEHGDFTYYAECVSQRQEYWSRGGWFDDVTLYWREASAGKLEERHYDEILPNRAAPSSLQSDIELAAGEKKTLRVVFAWYLKSFKNTWNPFPDQANDIYYFYTTQFKNSKEIADYFIKNYRTLKAGTKKFTKALFSSSLSEVCKEAISSNLCTLHSPTVYRLDKDGWFYAFEGCCEQEGSCEGSCTHVWNYAYALPFLFPDLEHSMREKELRYNVHADGTFAFRQFLPLGRYNRVRSCADGQFGDIFKIYRDMKISGDTKFVQDNYDILRRAMHSAFNHDKVNNWDMAKEGILRGRQHNTLDVEMFGVTSWLSGFYLLALACMTEIAKMLGKSEDAREYEALFEKGYAYIDKNLFNGEYFEQELDLSDHDYLEDFYNSAPYWNDETKEIRYQIGNGCFIDQVVAQWHAQLCGIRDLFDSKKVQSALDSIYKYNFRSMREFANSCRLFALNDDKGVIMCTFPREGSPKIPVPYATECMTGFEYQVAVHMILTGQEQRGLEIVQAIRDRYNGELRNPFSEIECGSHYARAMASYSLLLAYSGFRFDMTKNEIGFVPLHDGTYFWSVNGAWGTVTTSQTEVSLKVLQGTISLEHFITSLSNPKTLSVNGKNLPFTAKGERVTFEKTDIRTLVLKNN